MGGRSGKRYSQSVTSWRMSERILICSLSPITLAAWSDGQYTHYLFQVHANLSWPAKPCREKCSRFWFDVKVPRSRDSSKNSGGSWSFKVT
jgi:hypothetical protein